MKSVLTTEKGICYLCNKHGLTHLHHIYHSHHSKQFKKLQEKMGLVVYLCYECHEGTYGVHGSKGAEKDLDLKKIAQFAWMQEFQEEYPYEKHAQEAAYEEWIKKIGKNYL
jgi:hypothetical protein